MTAEPRMELLPDEWQALADVEAAARDAVELGTWARSRDRLRVALAELDKVRGRVASVDGDRIREDERVQEARFREHG